MGRVYDIDDHTLGEEFQTKNDVNDEDRNTSRPTLIKLIVFLMFIPFFILIMFAVF